jgi:hypothetical protein
MRQYGNSSWCIDAIIAPSSINTHYIITDG